VPAFLWRFRLLPLDFGVGFRPDTDVAFDILAVLDASCFSRRGGLVDLAGIEPATSSMPWNYKNRILLTAKALIVGRVGKNR
jgi:hypothetical protein